jgi:ribulose 1,5-bisphosphate synthetase/thiazole synthase
MTSTDQDLSTIEIHTTSIVLYIILLYIRDMADSTQPRKKAIIVGAGVGGTATAARLAHAGLDVEVYEKNEFSGGRCSLIHHEGYRFDQVCTFSSLSPRADGSCCSIPTCDMLILD